MSVILFGLTADVQRLLVDHMNVEEEGQIVIGVGVLLVKQDALLKMLDGVLVITDLKVGKAKVVVKLGIVLVNSLRLFERCDGKNVLSLFVHGDAIVKEGFPGAGMVLLKVFLAYDC